MVVSVIMMPAELMPKSSSLTVTHGSPSIKIRLPVRHWIFNTLLQRSTIEVPGVFAFVLQEGFAYAEKVLGFLRQQLAVLVPDLFGRALQMDINPAIPFEAITAFQAIVFRDGGFPLRKAKRG